MWSITRIIIAVSLGLAITAVGGMLFYTIFVDYPNLNNFCVTHGYEGYRDIDLGVSSGRFVECTRFAIHNGTLIKETEWFRYR